MKRRLTGRNYGFLFAGIPALAGIPVFTAILVQAGSDINPAFTWAAIWCLMLATGGIILSSMLRYYRPSQGSEWITAVWVLVMVFFSMAAGPLAMAITHDATLGHILSKSLWLRWFIAILFLGSVALISWVRKQARDDSRNRDWLAEAERLSREAELNSLRQQLQPHFLFNSLNSIYALTGSDPGKARQMIQLLGDFLRGTLKKDLQQLTPFSEELEQAGRYLEIEQTRFAHRLRTDIHAGPDTHRCTVPPLILQPLMENAIKFGLYGIESHVAITLKAILKDGNLIITLSNPCGDPGTSTRGTGFGLESVKRRLFLTYGRNDLLQTETSDSIFTVQMKIPQSA